MKGVVERIFRQNILIGWESLFSGEAVNQIAQTLKTRCLADFQYSSLEDFGQANQPAELLGLV